MGGGRGGFTGEKCGEMVKNHWKNLEKCGKLGKHEKKLEKDVENMEKV